MADEQILKATTVTFNVEEQKGVRELDTFLQFSDFVHTALAEKIDRMRREQRGAP